MKNSVKIIPKAANAFVVEINNHLGEPLYHLDINTDLDGRLSIAVKDAINRFADVDGHTGLLVEDIKPITFHYLQIDSYIQNIWSQNNAS